MGGLKGNHFVPQFREDNLGKFKSPESTSVPNEEEGSRLAPISLGIDIIILHHLFPLSLQ